MKIKGAGDSALLLELDEVIDPRVNARAIAVAEAVRRSALPGIRDVVPTFRSVAVFFDPLKADVEATREVLARAVDVPLHPVQGRTIDVPVAYGGEFGPDLTAVAAWSGLTAEAVVDRHVSRAYRVFMLGFLPGFAYLGSVDDSIAAPRRETPRVRIPAGAVGIAGRQTGIYPRESPGGWQIVGRTPLRVFDTNSHPAALLAPGDTVRFRPLAGGERWPQAAEGRDQTLPARSAVEPDARSVTVVRPGLLTTIQDEGRWGHQSMGVPVGGALDVVSHRSANALVGNSAAAATLEVTLAGPELITAQTTRIAVAGADLQSTVDGKAVPPGTVAVCRAGSVLRFGERQSGARAYIAFDGGVNVPPVLGSRATHVGAVLGGLHGRALVAGDRVALGPASNGGSARRVSAPMSVRGGARLRVLPGPQDDFFPEHAFTALERARFMVTPQSNRMGYRLSGASLPRVPAREMISDATFAGGIQVPLSGEPILLMSDRQTTGGYPQIAVVIAADLPAAGQLAPGDWVEFVRCTRDEALAALADQEEGLRDL